MTHRPIPYMFSPDNSASKLPTFKLHEPNKANLEYALLIATFVLPVCSLFFAYLFDWSSSRNQSGSLIANKYQHNISAVYTINTHTHKQLKPFPKHILVESGVPRSRRGKHFRVVSHTLLHKAQSRLRVFTVPSSHQLEVTSYNVV